MTVGWASNERGLSGLQGVHASLTVDMIMTRRDDLLTCRLGESAAEVKSKNPHRFSYLPVVCEQGSICGLVKAEARAAFVSLGLVATQTGKATD